MSSRKIAATLLAAAAAALSWAAAAGAEQRTLSLLSDGLFPVDPDRFSYLQRLSPDGSRVFIATNEAMAGTDTDAALDVYERTAAGALIHLTDDPSGPDDAVDAYLTGSSSDGSYTTFETGESLAATDTDTYSDVYKRTPSGELIHVSDDPTGADGNLSAAPRDISSDGARVYFETDERLALTDTDSQLDLYEHGPGGLRHISDGPSGAADEDLEAHFSGTSGDGGRVYFGTAEHLLDTDGDHFWDVYMRTAAGDLVHVSDGANGPDADQGAQIAAIAADGARLWLLTAEALTDTDTDSSFDVYERSPAGELTHVTRDPTGPEDGIDAWLQWTSADGRQLVFETAEPMAASDGDTAADLYQRTPAGALIHLTDTPSGADENIDATLAGVSDDGSRLIFGTRERLAATDTDSALDAYERTESGALIHLSDDPTGPDDPQDVADVTISRDGTRAVFETNESLAATDTDTANDAYESGPGGLRHVTDDPTGPDAELDASLNGWTPDLSRLYFGTDESMAADDTDSAEDVYASTLVPDPPGPPAAGPPAGPSADTTAPRLTRLRVTRSVVRFTLSEPARVRIRVQRGRRARGGFTVSGRAGANRVRLRVRRPAPGRYRLTATPRDSAGNTGRARRTTFRLPASKENR